jgi:hypothetical protein
MLFGFNRWWQAWGATLGAERQDVTPDRAVYGDSAWRSALETGWVTRRPAHTSNRAVSPWDRRVKNIPFLLPLNQPHKSMTAMLTPGTLNCFISGWTTDGSDTLPLTVPGASRRATN